MQRSGYVGSIFIMNLHENIDQLTICNTFDDYGTILKCDANIGGSAFIHFEREEDADTAIAHVHDKFIKGQRVVLGHLAGTVLETQKPLIHDMLAERLEMKLSEVLALLDSPERLREKRMLQEDLDRLPQAVPEPEPVQLEEAEPVPIASVEPEHENSARIQLRKKQKKSKAAWADKADNPSKSKPVDLTGGISPVVSEPPPHLRNGSKSKSKGRPDAREGDNSVRDTGGRGKGHELQPARHFADPVAEGTGRPPPSNVSFDPVMAATFTPSKATQAQSVLADDWEKEANLAQPLTALKEVPMTKWTEDQVMSWTELIDLDTEIRAALRTAFKHDGDINGEELVAMTPRGLLKMLKQGGMKGLKGDLEAAAEVVLALRDALLTPSLRPLRGEFDHNNKKDWLGCRGQFGQVMLCKLDGHRRAVKRVDATMAELVTKEINALSRAAETEDCGHKNVVHYYGKDADQFFVYIYMELCDYATLASGLLVPCDLVVQVAKLATPEECQQVVEQLFDGIEYLHRHQIVHRDLKPTNILFKRGVLKICDMGQSRILVGGATVAQTGSRGGTLGWMSPEELVQEVGEVFESRRSGDIHTAGSLMFYILTRGVHAFGDSHDWLKQQTNISSGRAVNRRRLGDKNCDAYDLFMRMTLLEPKARPTIEEVQLHPALWDAETKLKNVCDWSKSWERGAPLQQKLAQHAAAVRHMLGAEGWLAKLDEPVRRRLLAHRHYDGREVTHLLQAVRTTHRLL
jgi:hypothetical protein